MRGTDRRRVAAPACCRGAQSSSRHTRAARLPLRAWGFAAPPRSPSPDIPSPLRRPATGRAGRRGLGPRSKLERSRKVRRDFSTGLSHKKEEIFHWFSIHAIILISAPVGVAEWMPYCDTLQNESINSIYPIRRSSVLKMRMGGFNEPSCRCGSRINSDYLCSAD